VNGRGFASRADSTKSASALITLSPSECHSNGYEYVRAVTIDHRRVPNTDQANFPLLFSALDPAFKTTGNGGHVTSEHGYDIMFTSDATGNNVLPFEQESFSSSTGGVTYWINIPNLSHSADTVIYMWYGNPNVSTSQAQPTSLWNSNFKGVWHFGTGATLSAADSTSNAANGTIAGAVAGIGEIGNGAIFGGNRYITFSSLPNFSAGDFTVSAWVKFSSLSAYNVVMGGKLQASNVLFISTQSNGQGLRMGRTNVAEDAAAASAARPCYRPGSRCAGGTRAAASARSGPGEAPQGLSPPSQALAAAPNKRPPPSRGGLCVVSPPRPWRP